MAPSGVNTPLRRPAEKIFEKGIDKSKNICYNSYRKTKGNDVYEQFLI